MKTIDGALVTAAEMQAIEQRWFDAGMPVAALMEKAATAIGDRVVELTQPNAAIVILAGPGHNGGDALVVARELHLRGYDVTVYQPFAKLKPLTEQHSRFADYLDISFVETLEELTTRLDRADAILDGLFGFGQTRPIVGDLAIAIERANRAEALRIALDIPTGLHTDTGEAIGDELGAIAFRADVTLCLGLRKLGLVRDAALPFVGRVELLPFGLRPTDIEAVFPDGLAQRRVTQADAIAALSLPRSPLTHKYKEGHLLLICGSQRYIGASLLAGLGARASGVGMLTIAVPASLKTMVAAQLPEAVVLAANESESGAIVGLPEAIAEAATWEKYDAIACGCGLTTEPTGLVQQLLIKDRPLLLDADALNILAELPAQAFAHRTAPTILTPHPGEFRRLFGHRDANASLNLIRKAPTRHRAIVVHKGARPIVAALDRPLAIVDAGSPGLARGGSGDVLTGLMGGLVATAARQGRDLFEAVAAATWWHAEGGRRAAAARSQLGVDGATLAEFINRAIADCV